MERSVLALFYPPSHASGMAGWSPEIANEFIRRAAAERRHFDQMQLQKLVYIANGWCLTDLGEPLTLDRPEAWDFGPVYKRLADILVGYGLDPVTREITEAEAYEGAFWADKGKAARSDLNPSVVEVLDEVFQDYGGFEAERLSVLTQADDTPWFQVFAGGVGRSKDIPFSAIRTYFAKLQDRFSN